MSQSASTPLPPSVALDVFAETTLPPVGQVRRGILIVDHQNLVGLCRHQRFFDVDPQWPLDMARRITNCERAILVTDLAVPSPITGNPYLAESEAWYGNGYKIVHVPAKTQRIWDSQTESDQTRRKDMTDHGLREEIETWRAMPGVTDILVLTHDVDSAKDLQKAAWSDGKRIILLTVGSDGISYQLKQLADQRVNVLGYPAAYSFLDLERRQFWRIKNNPQDMTVRLTTLLNAEDGVRRYAFLRRQLADAKAIVLYLLEKRLVHPDKAPEASQLSWRLLRNSLHDMLREEKLAAKLQSGASLPEAVDRNSLEVYERELAPAQTKACQASLDEIIRIMTENGLLFFLSLTREGSSNVHRHFYLNLEHPAVQTLLALDCI